MDFWIDNVRDVGRISDVWWRCIGFVFVSMPLYALPPFIPIAERVQGSDLVVVCSIDRVRMSSVTERAKSVQLRMRVERVLKGNLSSPELRLGFFVFPDSFENYLRDPPAEGRYVVFLVRDSAREQYVLYRPHPFAFIPYEEDRVKEIQGIIK